MNDDMYKASLIRALDRIADALEAANRLDPLAALAAVMYEQPDEPGPPHGVLDPNADLPEYIRRAMGME